MQQLKMKRRLRINEKVTSTYLLLFYFCRFYNAAYLRDLSSDLIKNKNLSAVFSHNAREKHAD